MNESTLEGRVHKTLEAIFPGFESVDITHQNNFTLKFGHHEIIVDNKYKSKVMGRLDILVSIKDVPTAIFELKRPDINLTSDDVAQGISYARLTDPITPLMIVSNGTDTEIYDTYTKELIENDIGDEVKLGNVVKAGMKLAANKKTEAITLLLGEDSEIFSQIIDQISLSNFTPFIGELTDYRKCIAKDFNIPREASKEILGASSEKHLIALTGNSFSGKTNVLWEVFSRCDRPKQTVAYFDANSSYGILQQIANHISRQIKISINKDKVRNLIINGFVSKREYSLIILIDNWSNDINRDVQNEIHEIIDLFNNSGNTLVLSVNRLKFKELTHQKNRESLNKIGHESHQIELGRLSETEFKFVNDVLMKACNHFFSNGAQFHPWFLQPRSLRVIAGNARNELPEITKRIGVPPAGKDLAIEISSIPEENLLDNLRKMPISKEFAAYLKKHTECFIEEGKDKLSAVASISRFTTGGVTLTKLKTRVSEIEIESFSGQELLRLEEVSEKETLVYPILVELASVFAPDILEANTRTTFKSDGFDAAYNYFKSSCEGIPFGDMVGAKAMRQIGTTEIRLYGDLFNALMKDEPTKSSLSDGSEVLLKFADTESIHLRFEGDNQWEMVHNILPWSIASYLLMKPCLSEGESFAYAGFFMYLSKIAQYDGALFYLNQELLSEPTGIRTVDIHDYGEVLDSSMGIIEPIVRAMKQAVLYIPKEMKIFADEVCASDNLHLINRLYTATVHSKFLQDGKVKDTLSYINNKAHLRFIDLLDSYLNQEDPK